MATTPQDESSVGNHSVETVHRFFYCLDERQYEDMAALFAADGQWRRKGETLTGPQELLTMLQSRSRTVRVRHVMTNGHATPEPDGAVTVRLYQTVYKGQGAVAGQACEISGPSQLAVVTVRLRSGPDGGWLIHRLESHKQFDIGKGV